VHILCPEINLIPLASGLAAALCSPPVPSLLVNHLLDAHQTFTQPSLVCWLYSCRLTGCEMPSSFSFQGGDRFFSPLVLRLGQIPRNCASGIPDAAPGSCNRLLTDRSVLGTRSVIGHPPGKAENRPRKNALAEAFYSRGIAEKKKEHTPTQ